MRRMGWALVMSAGLLGACNGFPRTVPIADAERMPEKYPTYDASPSSPILTVGNTRWMVMPGAHANIPADWLAPISGTGELWAAKWDAPPYSALYQPTGTRSIRVAGEVHF